MTSESEDMETVRSRIKAYELNQWYSETNTKNWMKTLTEDGRFPDLDYTDLSDTGYRLDRHFFYLLQMARAFVDEKSSLCGNKELKQKVDLALNHWLEHKYVAENWWYTEIGIPEYMNSLLYVLDEENLTEDQIKIMNEIAAEANMNGTGARSGGDKVVVASIYAKNAIWRKDEKDVEYIMEIIEGEVKFVGETKPQEYLGTGLGMEKDFSFHHRADGVNNTLSYGLAYLDSFMQIATMLSNTKYQFKDKAAHQLIDFYLDGVCKQMVFSCFKDEGLLNREICNAQPTEPESSEIVEQLIQIGGKYRKDELELVIKLRNSEYKEDPDIIPSYSKFFWRTELFTFQRPKFFSSVRMFSIRNKNMEYPFNEQGLLNHFRGDGANYFSLTGLDYRNLAPVYDYRKIPGATILQDEEMPDFEEIQKNGTEIIFTGGVVDKKELYGAVGFDFHSPHYDLQARKSWFFFDEEFVCLGAGINSEESNEIFTTLDQRYLKGDVMIFEQSKDKEEEDYIVVKKNSEKEYSKIEWIYHDNVGYYFMEVPRRLGVLNKEVEGNWRRGTHQTNIKDEVVTEKVFALWINHGEKPVDESYAYVILPNVTLNYTQNYKDSNNIEIIENSKKLQAVKNLELKIDYAVFYEEGKVDFGDDIEISVNSSCILLVKEEIKNKNKRIKEISISDPSRKNFGINLRIKGDFENKEDFVKKYESKKGISDLSITLPKGEYAGKSLAIMNEFGEEENKEEKEGEYFEKKNEGKKWFDGLFEGNMGWIILGILLALIAISLIIFIRVRKKKSDKKEIKEDNLIEEGNKILED